MRRLCFASLFLGLAAVSALSQRTAPSVFINTYPPPGAADKIAVALATSAGNKVGGYLLKEFPCVAYLDTEGATAILGWERDKSLLGNPTPDILAQIGGAIGAQYVVSVKAVSMPNGQTFTEVIVVDTKTNTVVARENSTPATGDDAVDAVEATAVKITMDLGDILKGQCAPHWTGTITFTTEMRNDTNASEEHPDGNGGKNVSSTTTTWHTVDAIVAILQTPIPKDDQQAAQVTRRYDHHDDFTNTSEGSQACRQTNGNPVWTHISNRIEGSTDDGGSSTAVVSISVTVDEESGTFRATFTYPRIATKWVRRKTDTGVDCGAASPTSASESGEGPIYDAAEAGRVEITGTFDPKNPNVLSGSVTNGDLVTGRVTQKWDLKLVRPKPSR